MSVRQRRSLLDSELQRPSALDSTPRNSDLLWLDKNENLDPVLLKIFHEVLQKISPLALATYPEAGDMYRKLARWVGVDPEYLLLTPGSDGAIRLVFEVFVEHGDDIIHTDPTFAMYPVYAQMFGAKAHTIIYEKANANPSLDPNAIFKALQDHRPKLLCIPNPDSPTGAILTPEVLRDILAVCEEVGAVLLLDEAYHPFYEWSAVPWTENSRNLVVARTFAKAWGVAGLRVGYAVAHPDIITLLHKMRPMYEVSTFAIEFMLRMLDCASEVVQSVSRIAEGKTFFVEEMRALGFNVLPTAGNFSHVAFGEQGQNIHPDLSKKVYYRQSFSQPCLAGYSRFTIAPQPIMAQVVDLIKQSVSEKTP